MKNENKLHIKSRSGRILIYSIVFLIICAAISSGNITLIILAILAPFMAGLFTVSKTKMR